LGQTQKYGGVKPVNGIPTLPSNDKNIYKQMLKNMHRFASSEKDHMLSQKGNTT